MHTVIRSTGATLIFLPPRRRAPPEFAIAAAGLPAGRIGRLYGEFSSGSMTVALTLAGCVVSIALYLCFGVPLGLWGVPL